MATLIAAGINTSGKIHQPDLLRSCKRLILVKTVNASGTIVPTSPIFHAREVSETSAIVASLSDRPSRKNCLLSLTSRPPAESPNSLKLLACLFGQLFDRLLVGRVRRLNLDRSGRDTGRHCRSSVVATDHPHVIERMLHAIQAGARG